MKTNKNARHNASVDFVKGELNDRGYQSQSGSTLMPDADIICYNQEKSRSVNLIVKTFEPGNNSCIVGVRSEKFYGENYFWVLAGIPPRGCNDSPEYYIIPNRVMAENASKYHRLWLETPGRDNRKHKDTAMRVVLLPPSSSRYYWDVEKYIDRWELIEKALID